MADRLNPAERLGVGSSITSQDGRFTLIMQADGNLVFYGPTGKYRWHTGTDGRAVSQAIMQTDGNFVVYGTDGAPIWATGTGQPGSWLIVQNDGNLVIYDSAGNPRWATDTGIVRVMVPGFLPSTSGLHFVNSFPMSSFPGINVLGTLVAIPGVYGLCGGMAFAARDYFEAGLAPPPDTTPPTSGPLFDYLWIRLLASFNLINVPPGPAKYMHLMHPALPDHETWASNAGLAPRGRAWVMINEEWPKIRGDIASGHPSPLGLVTIKSLDPSRVFDNHQVLAYGYELDGTDLVIYVYDPNAENNNNIAISLSIADPQHTTSVAYSGTIFGGDHVIWCFFRPDYSFSRPPIVGPGTTGNIHLRANNGQYVCAEGGGGGTVVANRAVARGWETFQLVDRTGPPLRSGDQVALRANNGQFVCAEGGGGREVVANRNAIREWETFTILRADGSAGEIANGQQVAVRANNGQFVCAEGGGGREVVANRGAIGTWETFTIEIV
ncbi:MAG: hypothetical protein AAB403_14080 [Planctomycetota bacterium]